MGMGATEQSGSAVLVCRFDPHFFLDERHALCGAFVTCTTFTLTTGRAPLSRGAGTTAGLSAAVARRYEPRSQGTPRRAKEGRA